MQKLKQAQKQSAIHNSQFDAHLLKRIVDSIEEMCVELAIVNGGLFLGLF